MRKFSQEDIVYMNDDTLFSTHRVIKDAVRGMGRKGRETSESISAEEELCYLEREIEQRLARKKAHREFLSQKNNFTPFRSRNRG